MTIIGELYTLAERPRTQALFSGVWGAASVLGPLVGGYITDALSWRWVFYINIPFGLLCVAVIATAYPAVARHVAGEGGLARRGAALLVRERAAHRARRRRAASCRGPATAAGAVRRRSCIVERRQAEPILPLDLLRIPVISRTLGVVFLVGVALFGAIAFVPLFVQGVHGRHGHPGRPGADAALPRLGDDVGRRRQGSPCASATGSWRLPAAC